MKRIKIGTKIMFWYTLLVVVLLAVFLPLLYYMIATSLFNSESNSIRAVMSHVMAAVEFEDNQFHFQDEIKIPADNYVVFWDQHNQIIYQNTQETWFFTIIYELGNIRRIHNGTHDWLIYDDMVQNNDDIVKIRICVSLERMEAALGQVKTTIFIVLPIFFLVTISGGLLIAKRALRPISRITNLAREIGHGDDLTKRITDVRSTDEVGELANTFNGMLDSLEKSFEKEKRFASDASHELRMPVAVIMANAEALLEVPQDEETASSVSTILAESNRMNTIIAQLLMLTRGMEGRYKLQLEQTDLRVVSDAVLEHLHEEAEHKAISLIDETEQDVLINADQSLITQMMLNLVSNAIKYGNHNGHVWIKIVANNSKCTIQVADDGMGIAPDALPLIFDRFYRTDPSRDRSGSGLGLSIVKWIVDAHKGKIEVHSRLGKGTTFLVRLDCK